MKKQKINVLSLFDGISCGQIALGKAGIDINKYYASEIDKYAIKVTNHNYPNTIQLGNITNIDTKELPNIDLLIGGSPCTNFSVAGNQEGLSVEGNVLDTLDKYLTLKENNFKFKGQSYLFWEYIRILKEIKPKYFLLENVKMRGKWEKIITNEMGVEPIEINSGLVSAQNRRRLYWTNIPGVELPNDKEIYIKDILEKNIIDGIKIEFDEEGLWKHKTTNKKYVILDKKHIPPYSIYETRTAEGRKERKRIRQLTGIDTTPRSATHKEYRFNKKYKSNCLLTVQSELNKVIDQNYNYRFYTNNEYCRMQTVPVDYFKDIEISDSQIRKLLGNGWTVDVVAHIFGYIK